MFQSLIITFFVVAASIGGLIIARKFLGNTDLRNQHDITDPYSQFVAMLFAVLLGFMVADSMQRFGVARETVQQEASSLGNVFRLSEGLAPKDCLELRELCLQYATEVVDDEWPMLAQKKDSPKAWAIYRQIWSRCTSYEPTSNRQVNAQQVLLSSMVTLGDCRRLRVEALHSGLPLVLWIVLFIGGAATIIFTYFFSADNLHIQVVMVGIVSLVICLNLFLLATYDDPFSGDVKVAPTAFETQIRLFKLENKVK
ncbi:MAG: DUF4239 domain-containing protein [Leptolyngbya sp.]|nr:DUF4239 domain-containing protein [Candidatus Melainabacteria bacterium]